ncbi:MULTISPECIES: excinuclease ABC subunit A [unclassified Campylobacter]|uniref:excinuclease ABC subunit A n=1 Tax=unclassified Campylobacter TaxID=2593542 RepID=UPI0014529AA2|nr:MULTISPECIES: excinuclease ABC subunit A [unclassified Campylobacter]QCD53248.1 putative membrane protein [Campylobacter sp. RM16192]
MRNLLAIFAFTVSLFASNLLTYNIYERSDRVDVMLSFDAPYEGNIFQKRENDMTMLIFNGLNFDQAVEKNLNSKILQELYIEPKQNSVVLSIKSSSSIGVMASKTSDGFGLRIRVVSTAAASTKNEQPISQSEQIIQPKTSTTINTQPDIQNIFDARYYMVIGVLIAFAIALWLLKNFIVKKTGGSRKLNLAGWLNSDKSQDVKILYEKPLDRTNKVMLLNHQNKKYLVLVGSSNVLLDKFGEDTINSENDFEAFFEENRKRIGQYLEDRQNALSAYKDKASLN